MIAAAVVVIKLTLGDTTDKKQEFATINITRGDLRHVVSATGEIRPLNTVNVGSQVSGTIDNLYVDFNTKVKSALKFLKDGDRVKVTVRFRGREMAHTSIGHDLLVKFGEDCSEIANVDKAPKLDGRHMSMFLSPRSNKK